MTSMLEPGSHIRSTGSHTTIHTPLLLSAFIPAAAIVIDLFVEGFVMPNTLRHILISRGHKLVIIPRLPRSPPWFSDHSPKLYPTFRVHPRHSLSLSEATMIFLS
jgi:hypothetical protein